MSPLHASPLAAVCKAMMGSVAAAALLVPGHALADTLELTAGEIVRGKVESIDARVIRFVIDRAGPVELTHDTVARLQIDGNAVLTTVNGERLIGEVAMANGAAIIVTRLGTMTVPLAEVSGVTHAAAQTNTAPASTVAEPTKAPSNSATVTLSFLSNQTSDFFGETRSRLLSLDLKYDRRISSSTSIGVRFPVYLQHSSAAFFEGGIRSTSLGIGDAAVSVSQDIHLPQGLPEFRLTLNAGLPTGRASGPNEVAAVSLTTAKWSLGGDVSANLPIGSDQLIGSIGYTRYWAAKGGLNGTSTNWMFGYAANLDPSRQLMVSLNGSRVREGDTVTTPAYGAVTLVQALPNSLSVSPMFAHGLNNDAADFLVALSITKAW